jgi:hypothetical protein
MQGFADRSDAKIKATKRSLLCGVAKTGLFKKLQPISMGV